MLLFFGLRYLVRELYDMVEDNRDFMAQIATLEADKLHLESRVRDLEVQLTHANAIQRAQGSVQEQLVEGFQAKGMAQGQQIMLEAAHSFYQGMHDRMANASRLQLEAETSTSKYKGLLAEYNDVVRRLNSANSEIERSRNRVEALTQQQSDRIDEMRAMRRRIASLEAQLAQHTANGEKGRENGSKTPLTPSLNASPNASQMLQKAFMNASPYVSGNLNGNGQEAKAKQNGEHRHGDPGDFRLARSKKTRHRLVPLEGEDGQLSGEVLIEHHSTGEEVGRFWVQDLRPGVQKKINGVSVLKCMLARYPGKCEVIKVTTQPNAQCCSKEHADEWLRIKAEIKES